MAPIKLHDEENCAILTERFTDTLDEIDDRERQLSVLKRVHNVLDRDSPQYFIHESVENCDELQIITVGGQWRIYCRLILGIPKGNKEYNILYLLDVHKHVYDDDTMETLDERVIETLEEITSLDHIESVEEYLDEMNAFYAEDIQRRIDRAESS